MSEKSKSNFGRKKKYSDNPMYRPIVPKDTDRGFPLLQLSNQIHSMNDLILDNDLKTRIQYVIDENLKADDLYSMGLKPKQKILFCGPPGTGKTLSAKIMSSIIGYQFVYVLFDSIVSSLLGETATNLRKIFSFIEEGKYVVLFDEFDVVGKRRDDPNEHGEVKRVVNNFMQMLDTYNGESIIIAATNHPQLLDAAVWRRVDEILYFDLPNISQRDDLLKKYLSYTKHDKDCDLSYVVKKTNKYSSADIAQICEDAIRYSVINERKQVTDNDLKWALGEQRRRKSTIAKSQ